jgi:hypothetical protein
LEARELADGTLVVIVDRRRLSIACAIGALALLLLAAWTWARPPAEDAGDRLWGSIGGAATLLACASAAFESSRFAFDPRTSSIAWRRRTVLGRRAGRLTFADVRAVLAEVPIGDDGIPSRRPCLLLADGRTLAMAIAYVPDHGDACVSLVERVRAVLAAGGAAPVDEVVALAGSGRRLDAVRILREREGLSLTEARRRLDELAPPGE